MLASLDQAGISCQISCCYHSCHRTAIQLTLCLSITSTPESQAICRMVYVINSFYALLRKAEIHTCLTQCAAFRFHWHPEHLIIHGLPCVCMQEALRGSEPRKLQVSAVPGAQEAFCRIRCRVRQGKAAHMVPKSSFWCS